MHIRRYGACIGLRSHPLTSDHRTQLFKRENFFRGRDNDDQLLKIVKVLGTDDSPFHLLGMGVCAFLEAALGMEVRTLLTV